MNKLIYIEQILLYYDTVQLFVGLDGVQTRYLCMLYDDDGEDKYIAIKISTAKLSTLLTGKIDLRSLYLSPEITNEYYSLTIIRDGELEITDEWQNIQEQMLPDKDAFVVQSTDFSNIIRERIEFHKPIIHLGFIDSNNSHEIKANVLAYLLASYQEFVINTHKKNS